MHIQMFRKAIKFFSNIRKSNSTKDVFIVLINNKQAIKYYKLNTLFLMFYSGYALISGYISDYPDHLKKTIKFFGFLTTAVVIGLYFFSNRHVRSLIYNKTKDTLLVETFKGFGFLSSKVQEIRVKDDIKYMFSLKTIIKYDTGIYVIKLRNNDKRIFSAGNLLLMRPVDVENKEELSSLMKRVIKK